ESEKYARAARDYEMRAASMPADAAKSQEQAAHSAELQPPPEPEPAPEPKPFIQEFALDVPSQISSEPAPRVASSARTDETIAEPPPSVPESGAPGPDAHEIDLSGEWDLLADETPVAAQTSSVDDTVELPAEESVEIVEEAAPVADQEAIAEKVQEARFYISQRMWEEAKTAVLDLSEMAPNLPEITELISAVSAGQSASTPARPVPQELPVIAPEPEFAHKPAPAEPSAPLHAAVEQIPVLDLIHEDLSHEAKEPAELPPPPKPEPAPVVEAKPVVEAQAKAPEPLPVEKSGKDFLSDFVLDLEQSLSDFPAVPPHSSQSSARPADPAPVKHVASSNGEMQDPDTTSVLSDILSGLQDDEAESVAAEEDPDTHYNLGIAFKEMGLLDEAIGELQKVCHAVDRGSGFTQPIQAYTWLAQCLVDKGVPEAAVRWYEKALHLPGLDTNSRCSIHYDLASAYEAFGDKKSALTNFMEVYGSNIDFRDVASRIKSLKS
ncbi:MAG TPA: hypothetical protein VJ723_06570, partial [Candidatus Angelobacter sp.]|nr:hypothetical protein [Candidatus Angelobacter sp.]